MITAARRAAAAVLVALLAALGPGTSPVLAADWGRVGALPGLGGARIWAVAFNPALPTTALAATDSGVYRTTDGGQTWKATPVHGSRVWTVGFDVRPAHTAFAGLAGGGVERSDDGGATWRDVSAGLPDRNVRAFAFGLGGLAVGTSDGVAVSVDGATWRAAGLEGYDISALAVAANSPQFTLIAGTDGGPTGGFLFRDPGPGPTWEPLAQGLPATAVVSSLGAGPLPQTAQFRPLVVATNKGTFHSIDGGTTWTPSGGIAEQVSVTSVGFSQLDPNLVYAGSDAGGSSGGTILRSTDGGGTFVPADKGLPADSKTVSSIAVAPAHPPLVMIAVDPPQGGAALYSEIDDTVPPPAGVTGERGTAPVTSVPVPQTHHTAPAVEQPSVDDEQSGIVRVLGAIFHFPLPLLLELIVAATAGTLGVRRWQRRLDVDGPP
ncbi:MAG TPA: hypothetical protein VH134_07700 [Candidatus Dormibacteraeota bacterium]|nr:hypothetical protein [Candidatus Dormibacteraeota bacterium]